MKAIVQRGYGSAEKLELAEIPVPTIGDDGVLVRVRAASVNSLDWRLIMTPPLVTDPLFRLLFKGRPTPKGSVPGSDHAGIVEAVGKNVTRFAPGDEVIGFRRGSFAQFVAGKETHFAPKPRGLTFLESAALPHAGLVALQGIRDHGRVKSGQRVLINGASGGIGHLALQYAKSAGAYVTAVCGAKAVDMVRSLGAD
jgi:NADPH:quinone reductase-like Zn-dependent oxidoreductase